MRRHRKHKGHDAGPIALLLFMAIGFIFWLFALSVLQARKEVREYCQPRGYVGGSIASRFGTATCIDKDGNHWAIPRYSDEKDIGKW